MASPFFFSLSFFLLSRAAAQPTPYSPYSNPPEFNSSMAIIIVILISVFFVMGFLSIYLRLCSEREDGSRRWSPRQAARGLDAVAIAAFPKVVYGDVKEHKIGKDALECAICLSEFEEEDSLRLIPTCDHVFHPECIDAWLAAHATCPICRADLAAGGGAGAAPVAREQQVAEAEVDRAPRLSRSKSTGHSIVVVRVDDCDRFTLRLPEQIRREVMSGKMRRSKSFAVLTQQGEGSSRGGRSFKFWTEGRSLFSKSFSLMSPRRDEGSTKRGPDRSGHGVGRSEQLGPGLC